MDIIITKKKPDPMGSATWYYGTAGEYAFEAKVYGEPSIFGIDEGRISKLWMMQPPGSALQEKGVSGSRIMHWPGRMMTRLPSTVNSPLPSVQVYHMQKPAPLGWFDSSSS